MTRDIYEYLLSSRFALPILMQHRVLAETIQRLEARCTRLQRKVDELETKLLVREKYDDPNRVILGLTLEEKHRLLHTSWGVCKRLAELAGMTPAQISHVINNKRTVDAETRKLIRDIVDPLIRAER